jgi:hypothetical protein
MRILIPVLILFIFSSCEDEVTAPVETNGNLIKNSSFEENGTPTLKYWTSSGTINFYEDTPPEGGKYSAGIVENWGPHGTLSITFPMPAGKRIIDFRCWSKTGNLPAEISLSVFQDTVHYLRSITVTDTLWQQYTILDTLNTSEGDSIMVELKGSISQLLPSLALYDNCYLRID